MLLYGAFFLEPRFGYVLGSFAFHVYGVVQVAQGFGVEPLGDGDEDLAHLRVLFEYVLPYGERGVVDGEEVLVVLEEKPLVVKTTPKLQISFVAS